MSNFAEATLTPLPTDVEGIRDRDNEDWHDSIAGDDVGGDELSASTTLTKAEALQAEGRRTSVALRNSTSWHTSYFLPGKFQRAMMKSESAGSYHLVKSSIMGSTFVLFCSR